MTLLSCKNNVEVRPALIDAENEAADDGCSVDRSVNEATIARLADDTSSSSLRYGNALGVRPKVVDTLPKLSASAALSLAPTATTTMTM